jgi:hypothetical protein
MTEQLCRWCGGAQLDVEHVKCFTGCIALVDENGTRNYVHKDTVRQHIAAQLLSITDFPTVLIDLCVDLSFEFVGRFNPCEIPDGYKTLMKEELDISAAVQIQLDACWPDCTTDVKTEATASLHDHIFSYEHYNESEYLNWFDEFCTFNLPRLNWNWACKAEAVAAAQAVWNSGCDSEGWCVASMVWDFLINQASNPRFGYGCTVADKLTAVGCWVHHGWSMSKMAAVAKVWGGMGYLGHMRTALRHIGGNLHVIQHDCNVHGRNSNFRIFWLRKPWVKYITKEEFTRLSSEWLDGGHMVDSDIVSQLEMWRLRERLVKWLSGLLLTDMVEQKRTDVKYITNLVLNGEYDEALRMENLENQVDNWQIVLELMTTRRWMAASNEHVG